MEKAKESEGHDWRQLMNWHTRTLDFFSWGGGGGHTDTQCPFYLVPEHDSIIAYKLPASGISPDSRRAEGQHTCRIDSMYINDHIKFWPENAWTGNVSNKYCYSIPVLQFLLYTEYSKIKTQNNVVYYRINSSHVTTPVSHTTDISFFQNLQPTHSSPHLYQLSYFW